MTSNTDSAILNSTQVWSPDDHTLILAPLESQARLPATQPSHVQHPLQSNPSMEDGTTVVQSIDTHHKDGVQELSFERKSPSHPPGMHASAPTGPTDSNGKHTGRETPESTNEGEEDHARDSEPSPDVNLDFPSTEDVTDVRAADGRRGDLLGGYSHPLAVAEATPGRIYIPPQSGSVRSRGRVPDPLEVLPFGDDAGHVDEFGARQVAGAGGSTGGRRPAIPHSSYYTGPPPLDSAYGSDPVGQIGVHFPREILRIERDYSGGELCQFHPTFPLELEGRITPMQHQESMNSINEVLISAHRLLPSFIHNAFAILTLYISTLFIPSHYDREMRRLQLLIDQLNREIYNPQGLNILWPQRSAFLFLEIEYY